MIWEIFKRVIENLVAYRKRSVMTIVGIVWGIASFILLIAYGDGFERAMILGMSYFGDRIVVTWNGQTSMQAGGSRSGRVIRTTPEDVEVLRRRATLVKKLSPEVYEQMQLRWGDRITAAGIRAVNDEYGEIRGMFMGEGRFISADDVVTIGDRRNMAYMGNVVTYGRGKALIVGTGAQTELGKVASLLQNVGNELTPLQKRLDQLGKLLAVVGFAVSGLIFVMRILMGEPLRDMMLTAVSVAVAIVPEGLPAVVTITLAIGAAHAEA